MSYINNREFLLRLLGLHCIKYKISYCLKLCRNYEFPRNFQARNLDEISVFYAVLSEKNVNFTVVLTFHKFVGFQRLVKQKHFRKLYG